METSSLFLWLWCSLEQSLHVYIYMTISATGIEIKWQSLVSSLAEIFAEGGRHPFRSQEDGSGSAHSGFRTQRRPAKHVYNGYVLG